MTCPYSSTIGKLLSICFCSSRASDKRRAYSFSASVAFLTPYKREESMGATIVVSVLKLTLFDFCAYIDMHKSIIAEMINNFFILCKFS